VVAEFCIPLLAVLAVKELIQKPEILKNNVKQLYISLGVTGGMALLFAVAPKLFFSSFISGQETQALQSLPPEHIQAVIANLTDMRVAIFTADAWRSFFIVAIGGVLVWLFINKKLKAEWTVAAILLLCLVDMWGVNKRYLNDSDFVPESNQQQLLPHHLPTSIYYRIPPNIIVC
jgi:hypothetical protein